MNAPELIDRLCAVVEAQAKIIREQGLFIENQLAVDDEVKKQFAAQRDDVDEELDLIEVGLRPFHNTGLRKGDDPCVPTVCQLHCLFCPERIRRPPLCGPRR